MPVFVDDRPLPRLAWWVTLALALTVALVGAGVLYGTQAYATEHEGRILPGVTVAGVDLGGMTADEAMAAAEGVVAPDLDRTVTLRWEDREWTATPRDLGATTDVEGVVAAALEASDAATMGSMVRMRWLGEALNLDQEISITHTEEGVRAFVDQVAAELHVPAQDAAVRAAGIGYEIVPEQRGQVLDTDAATAGLMHALEHGGDTVDLDVHPLPAARSAEDFTQVLVLRQREHILELHQHGVLTHSWNVAVGTSGHRTPTGIYEVTLKRHMPTWVNPAPNGWGSGMPARIGPGVNNPLGVRALNWSAPAIRFHGTANVNSIGRDASKGCVRLTNADVVQLYDLVEVGTPIVSIG
ncbi:MAG TPA: L,D-transpeptidase family protein [Egibacteraceae bacterium]|nr:L,D-transpeptidase family protein [Egibacteraceae bacterium]